MSDWEACDTCGGTYYYGTDARVLQIAIDGVTISECGDCRAASREFHVPALAESRDEFGGLVLEIKSGGQRRFREFGATNVDVEDVIVALDSSMAVSCAAMPFEHDETGELTRPSQKIDWARTASDDDDGGWRVVLWDASRTAEQFLDEYRALLRKVLDNEEERRGRFEKVSLYRPRAQLRDQADALATEIEVQLTKVAAGRRYVAVEAVASALGGVRSDVGVFPRSVLLCVLGYVDASVEDGTRVTGALLVPVFRAFERALQPHVFARGVAQLGRSGKAWDPRDAFDSDDEEEEQEEEQEEEEEDDDEKKDDDGKKGKEGKERERKDEVDDKHVDGKPNGTEDEKKTVDGPEKTATAERGQVERESKERRGADEGDADGGGGTGANGAESESRRDEENAGGSGPDRANASSGGSKRHNQDGDGDKHGAKRAKTK